MSDRAAHDFNLPPRRETFLARYPRNLKMAATVFFLALILLPPAFIRGYALHRAAQPVIFNSTAQDASNLPSMPVAGSKIEADIKAPSLNDQNDRSVKLAAAPDSRITEDDGMGSLPRTSEDGMRPWQIYARPFNAADKRPRIAIVITGLGQSRTITDEAISQLPPTITLAFDGNSAAVGAWGQRARQDGHEILLQVPMEPFDYPQSDPGPDTLLSTLPNSDNLGRLLKVMRRATGYVGITSASGSRFTSDTDKMTPIMDVMHTRGLMILDARATPHSIITDLAHNESVPVATVTQRLDGDLSPDAIAGVLDNLEQTARQNGRAIGIASATPVMMTQLQTWAKGLADRGIALAPITAMVQ